MKKIKNKKKITLVSFTCIRKIISVGYPFIIIAIY